MGKTYRREKRERRLAHVKALIQACSDLNVDLTRSFNPNLSLTRIETVGSKNLGVAREHILMEATAQGVDSELLYDVARRYAPIPRMSRPPQSAKHLRRVKRRWHLQTGITVVIH